MAARRRLFDVAVRRRISSRRGRRIGWSGRGAESVQFDDRGIGVFDSGIGGLTVVRELRRKIPSESIVYFGDTARVPYGIKSPQAVTAFSRQICDFLLRFNPKLIVVACNTASAAALPALLGRYELPLLGVVEPGAAAAVRAADGRPIAVIATEATVNSDAYRAEIVRRAAGATVHQKACPLFVPAVEEGRDADNPIVAQLAEEYLGPLRCLGLGAVVLGCTHYPLIKPAIRRALGGDVTLVDSAEQTAAEVAAELARRGALSGRPAPGKLSCYVSDNPQRFREVGQRFLGHPIVDVTWVSLDELVGAASSVPS
ncbi:MAG: glutamate racemase [Phycisphaerae bacterium]